MTPTGWVIGALWTVWGIGLTYLLVLLVVIMSRSRPAAKNRRAPETEVALPPVTFLRPIKAGVPSLREKLERFLAAICREDQVIFGVDESSPELQTCVATARAFQDHDIKIVECRR